MPRQRRDPRRIRQVGHARARCEAEHRRAMEEAGVEMKAKPLAVFSDVVLLVLAVGGAILLFATGIFSSGWTTDRPLLPLVVDWSRILLLAAAVGVVAGVLIGAFVRRRRDHVVDGRVVRYSGFDRLVHWSLAIGFVLDFATGIWLLRWLGLTSNVDSRPTL